MWSVIASGGRAYRAAQTQWAPTLVAHDPTPPLALFSTVELASGAVELELAVVEPAVAATAALAMTVVVTRSMSAEVAVDRALNAEVELSTRIAGEVSI